PPIPDQACHPFHGNAATDSTANLPPRQLLQPARQLAVGIQTDHPSTFRKVAGIPLQLQRRAAPYRHGPMQQCLERYDNLLPPQLPSLPPVHTPSWLFKPPMINILLTQGARAPVILHPGGIHQQPFGKKSLQLVYLSLDLLCHAIQNRIFLNHIPNISPWQGQQSPPTIWGWCHPPAWTIAAPGTAKGVCTKAILKARHSGHTAKLSASIVAWFKSP